MSNQLRQSFALLPCCSQPWVWIAKPVKSGVKKLICGRSAATGALSVERPAKNELRRAILFGSHPPEPVVYQRRFSDPGPGKDCNDVQRMNKSIKSGLSRIPCRLLSPGASDS